MIDIESDYKWYKENLADIYKLCGDSYVAIQNKKIIGVYKSYEEAIRKTPEPMGSYIVQKSGSSPEAYTVYIYQINADNRGDINDLGFYRST